MKQFLFDTHVHTSQVSPCANMPADRVVAKYVSMGYDGIIITDHFCDHSLDKRCEGRPWDEKIDFFLSGYHEAVKAAGEYDGFTVLPGMELRFRGNDDNDYLVFGIDDSFLRTHDDILTLDIESFRQLADENNLMIFQAHPFRPHMTITPAKLLDGIEIYNGNSNHNSSNPIAEAWAQRFSLRGISGSDFHGEHGMRSGGIVFTNEIKTSEQLVSALRDCAYSIY